MTMTVQTNDVAQPVWTYSGNLDVTLSSVTETTTGTWVFVFDVLYLSSSTGTNFECSFKDAGNTITPVLSPAVSLNVYDCTHS